MSADHTYQKHAPAWVQEMSDKPLIPTSPVHQYLLRIHIADQWGATAPQEPKQIFMQYETEAVL